MDEYLLGLINRMLDRSDYKMKKGFNSKSTISWKATREAEKIEKEDYISPLIEFIKQEKDKNKRDKAYFILGNLSKNTNDKESVEFLISRIAEETDKYIISSLLDRVRRLKKIKGIDLRPIIDASKSDTWQIRHSAIQALQNSSDKIAEERLIEILKNAKNNSELIYANSTLSNIGSMECIPFLKEYIDYKKLDVACSALRAIIQIAKENEINTYREKLAKGRIKPYAILGVVKYGNKEDSLLVEKRIKELVSKQRKVKYFVEGMKTELIIGLEFMMQYAGYEEIKNWLLNEKASKLWDFEIEWIKNHPLAKPNG